MNKELYLTADGSHTLYVPELNERYHSLHGAITESMHVFIKMGLHEALETGKDLCVLEIGFGTGLNALLTAIESEKLSQKIEYHTLEPFPLSESLISQLNYSTQIDSNNALSIFEKLHRCDWEKSVTINDYFNIKKHQLSLAAFIEKRSIEYDLIYFDAFAPEKQAEMWTPEVFKALYQAQTNEGILTTYCAKGVVRRTMEEAGYKVERAPGPPGKREMIRARKISS